MAAHGHAIDDIGLVLITHNHTDHIGLAEIVVEHSGAEVAALGSGRRAARPPTRSKPSATTSSRSS